MIVFAVLLNLGLAGCLPGGAAYRLGAVDDMLPLQPDHCGLSNLTGLQGQPMARLADFRLIGPLRVLWPGQEISNEIIATRLNAEVDVTGRILRLMCG